MSKATPQIETILDDLTTLCCNALHADGRLDHDRMTQLVESLSINGWKRHSEENAPLSAILQQRVRHNCRETATHRGAELESVAIEVQQAYDRVSRYSTSTPDKGQDVALQSHPPRG